MTPAFITNEQLQETLGFLPREGRQQLRSPDDTQHQLVSHIECTGNRVLVQTRAEAGDGGADVDMLRLALEQHDGGWLIREQVHSGIAVNPDTSLALSALAHNLSATPMAPARKAHRP